MKCKIMQFVMMMMMMMMLMMMLMMIIMMMMMMMMMLMGVEEDRRKRYKADEGRKWKRMRRGGGEREGEEDTADFSSAIVGPDSISSRETRIHRCAPCSEHVWGKHRFLQQWISPPRE